MKRYVLRPTTWNSAGKCSKTSCFRENDILINDRGFRSREMTNYLKTVHKVDAYIPARENMTIYQDAVKLAVTSGKWQKHPNRKRMDQEI